MSLHPKPRVQGLNTASTVVGTHGGQGLPNAVRVAAGIRHGVGASAAAQGTTCFIKHSSIWCMPEPPSMYA